MKLNLSGEIRHQHFQTVTSTNDIAKDFARKGEGEFLFITAENQEKGRGRYSREWVSPAGNLYLSVILDSKTLLENAAQYSYVLALAVLDTLQKYLPTSKVELKWPNDVLVNSKKISGILLESETSGNQLKFLVGGVGINLADFPKDVIFPATSLKNEGVNVTIEDLAEHLIGNIVSRIKIYKTAGFSVVREQWLAAACGLKHKITVKTADSEVSGVFTGLDPQGMLIIAAENKTIKISSGDVFF